MSKHKFNARINQKALQTFLNKLENKYGEHSLPRVVIFSDGSGRFEYDISCQDDVHDFDFNSISELNTIISNPDHYLQLSEKDKQLP